MKTKNIRKFLYAALFSLVAAMLTISCVHIFNDQINNINTWQYNATYDFKLVENESQGQKQLFLDVETPEQLAGAFNALAVVHRPSMDILDGGGSLPSRPSNPSPSTGTSTKSDVTINDVANKISEFEKESTVVRLTKNLTFDNAKYNWVPADFSGTFDGAGFVISGLRISSSNENIGFVATNSGTIKNIIFKDVVITCNVSAGSASKVGIVAATNTGTIKNVNIIGNSSVTANLNSSSNSDTNRQVGGIAAINNGTIMYCINRASVTYGKHIGGIAGISSGTIQYCYNYGEVKAVETTKSNYVRIGGIVGEATAGTISLCVNHAKVSGDSNTSGDSAVGGIVGYCYITIKQCGNLGEINAGSTSTYIVYAGGICGINSATIEDCFNKGAINGTVATSTWDPSEFNPVPNRLTYAQHVGELWLWDNHVVSGEHTEKGAAGAYAETVNKSKKYYQGGRAYNGGIVGYTSQEVKRCYNLGSISYANSKYSQVYEVYTKQDAQCGSHNYNMLISTTITYGVGCYAGNIAGYTSSSVSNTYFKADTKISVSYGFSAKQKYSTTGGGVQDKMSLSSWTNNSEDSTWFATDVPGYYFNTYYNIEASSVSKINLIVHYKKNIVKDPKTYYTINTGLTSSTLNYVEKGTQGDIILSNLNGDSKWAQNDSINGGYPYIDGMYW